MNDLSKPLSVTKLAVVGFTSLLLLSACSTKSNAEQSSATKTSSSQVAASQADTSSYITDADRDTSYDMATSTTIALSGNSATVSGEGASYSDGLVSISKAGTYIISGNSSQIQVQVTAGDSDEVHLILDNTTMTADKAPIAILKAGHVYLTLAEGSDNSLSDSSNNTDKEVDATLFSKTDLTINGSGTLSVDGKTNDAIKVNDSLHIVGGNFKLTAVGDTLTVNDELNIVDSKLALEAGEDAVKVDNDDDQTLGNMYLANNTITITTGDDGIHASGNLVIDSGNYDIKQSAEGIEGARITINGGQFNIEATDDGINAANANLTASQIGMTFNGGDFVINMGAGDTDAVDSNGDLTVAGANFDITAQSAFDADGEITYTGGTILVNGEEISEITVSGPGPGGFGGNGMPRH